MQKLKNDSNTKNDVNDDVKDLGIFVALLTKKFEKMGRKN